MLTTRLMLELTANLSAALELSAVSAPLNYRKQIALDNGTGAGKADKIFHDRRTIAASSSESLDLAGSLTDPLGSTITFARVKGLLIAAASSNSNNVVVGGAAENGFDTWVGDASDEVVIRPGGLLALFATDATAYAVTASTGDLLQIANSGSGTSVTYDIVIIGASV